MRPWRPSRFCALILFRAFDDLSRLQLAVLVISKLSHLLEHIQCLRQAHRPRARGPSPGRIARHLKSLAELGEHHLQICPDQPAYP
jgi:hypothetical protein